MKIAIVALVVAILTVGIYLAVRYFRPTKTNLPSNFTDEDHEKHYKLKSDGLELILGKMNETVGHAIIPFEVGGAVDMYYFPNGIVGTSMATMELIDPNGNGPKPNRVGTFELVAFTKHKMAPINEKNDRHPFEIIERRFCGIFTTLGSYSFESVLNPGETCEVPGKDGEPNKCLIFDEYKPNGIEFRIGKRRHCLLLCMEIFRSEMEFAMANGSGELLRRLKEKGYFPYSDLDRPPLF